MGTNMRLFGTLRGSCGKHTFPVFIIAAALMIVPAMSTAWGAASQAVDGPKVRDKGVGPIKQIKLGPIDPALAKAGQKIFEQRCSACHKLDQRYVGPPLRNVANRMEPEWIMNMILNSSGMLATDPNAKKLLGEYFTPMSVSGITEDQARSILEYLRQAAVEQTGKKN
jgi:mono/diheme cytochrome c family protein